MKTYLITLSTLAVATSLSAGLSFLPSTLIANPPVIAALTTPPVTNSAPTTITPAATPAVENLFSEADTTIESSTQDHHEGLTDLADRVNRGVKDQIEAWKSQGFTAPLESDEKVSRALMDFTQKLSSLNLADEATWASVKTDTLGSLHHLQGVYADLAAASAKKL
jgi:hypothetical protein